MGKRTNTLAVFGIGVVLGAVIIGMFAAVPSLRIFVRDMAVEHGFWLFMAGWIGFMAMLAVAAFVQIVLHETGHLLFGLLTGYRFVSFRIGSLVLVRDDKGYGLRRFSVAGTGGQCLLEPPANADKFPYKLYCMGGVIVNLLTAIVAYVVVLVADVAPMWGIVLMSLSVTDLFIGLMNGMPLKIGGVPNDGYNLFFAGRSPETLRALWLQLKVNALQTRGVRLRDMPDEWFSVPSDADLGNYMYTAVAGMAASRLLEMRRVDEAREMFRRVDVAGAGGVGVYRMEVACELLFLEIVAGADRETAERMFTPELRRYVDIYSRYMLSRVRLLYAYARFVECDETKAAALYVRASKMVAQSPSKGDAAAEMEIIEWVKGLALCNS